MKKLEVNGKEIDLSTQLIALTRQVIDPSSPTTRLIGISNKFELPITQNNKEVFDFPFTLNSDSLSLDKNYPAKYIDQTPIFDGIGFISEYNRNTFSFQLADKTKDLFDNLKDEIKKLGFDDQDIIFDQTNYDTLKLPSSSRLWIWPIVSMHEDRTIDKSRFTAGNDGLKYSRPMFSLNYLLNSLVNNQGWTFENDQDLSESVCISANHTKFYVTSYQKTINEALVLSGSQHLTGLNTVDFNKGNVLDSTTINIGGTKQKFRLRGEIEADSQVRIKIKGTESVTLKETVQEFIVDSSQTEIDLTSKDFSSSTNDIAIEVLIEGNGNFEFKNTLLYTIIEEQDFGDLAANPLLDYKVKAYDNFLKISQLDLFKLSAILTNSIYEPDSFTKNIKIKSLKNLSKLNSVDWSDKYDQDTRTVGNILTKAGQNNELVYDNDDTIDSSVGKDTFKIFNESFEDVKEYLKIPFSATNDIELNGFSIGDFDIYNDTKRENDLNPRILYFYNDSAPGTYTLGRFLELDWRSLKANYYKNWFDSSYRTRVIEGYADLNKLDVLGFDFTQLVYIDSEKSYFFVLIIEDYIPGQKTKIKLLKFL